MCPYNIGFFFITNINAGAQDSKPSCSSLLNSHKCDDLGKIENTDVARPDIAGVTVIKGFSPASIKVGEKALNIDGILKLKKLAQLHQMCFHPKRQRLFWKAVQLPVVEKIHIIVKK